MSFATTDKTFAPGPAGLQLGPKKTGIQIGMKGKKYGLQKPAMKASVFGDIDSEEEEADMKARFDPTRQPQKKKSLQMEQEAAMAVDPSVYDYDGVYEDMQDQKNQQNQMRVGASKNEEKKPRYIGGIIQVAKERERWNDRIYERKLEKEIKAEEEYFGDKDKFITSSYKKKLEEKDQWEKEQREQEAVDAANDVRKKGGLTDFYRNLLNGDVQDQAAKEQEQSDHLNVNTGKVYIRDGYAKGLNPAPQPEAQLPELKQEDEQQQQDGTAEEQPEQPEQSEPEKSEEADGSTRSDAVADVDAAHILNWHNKPKPESKVLVEETPEQIAAKFARKNDDSAVMSAKERYLARKRQKKM